MKTKLIKINLSELLKECLKTQLVCHSSKMKYPIKNSDDRLQVNMDVDLIKLFKGV